MKNIIIIIHELGIGGAERVATVISEYIAADTEFNVNIVRYTDNYNDYKINNISEIYTLPYSKFRFLRILKRLLAFFKYCKAKKADIVMTLSIGDYLTYAFKKITKKKLILSQRNDPIAEYSNLNKKKRAIKYFRAADIVVFQTPQEREYFPIDIQKKGIVIENPIKNNLPNPYSGIRKKEIVNFCRLEPQKNLILLIKTFKRIHQEYPDYILKIYGRGSLKNSLEKFISDNGLGDCAFIKDFITDIHEEIKNASMFVSTSDYEGISNSMIEAMAIGLPVICTDCPAGGARMMIKSEYNGLLVPVGDENVLYNSIKRLVKDPEFAKRLSENAAKISITLKAEVICYKWKRLLYD